RPAGGRGQRGLLRRERVEQQLFLARPAPVDGGLAHARAGGDRLDAQALRPGFGEHAERGVNDGAVGALTAGPAGPALGRRGVRLHSTVSFAGAAWLAGTTPFGGRASFTGIAWPTDLAWLAGMASFMGTAWLAGGGAPAPAAVAWPAALAWLAAPSAAVTWRAAPAAARPGIQRITTSAPSSVIAAEISVVRC